MSELLRFFKDMRDNGYGLAEIAAQLGTSAIAEPVAGFAAMYDPANGADAIREGMTYQPRSQEAQQYSQSIGNAAKTAIKPAMPIIDTWKQGVDIAGQYSPVVGAGLRTVPTAIGIAMGAKPALQAGRQVSKGLGKVQDRLIANATAPSTLNTAGFRGQRGAIGVPTQDKPYVSWSEDMDVHYDMDGNETPGDEYAIIDKIYVPDEQRKQGVARKMLRETINEIQTKLPEKPIRIAAYPFGENKIDMQDLVNFYESEGFDVINTDGHAVIMELKSKPKNRQSSNLLATTAPLVPTTALGAYMYNEKRKKSQGNQ